MTRLYKPLLEPLGLTYPQYLEMQALRARDGLAVGEFGEQLSLDSGTLTPLFKRQQAAGLLGRLRDTADQRRVRARLSRKGRALRARAAAVPLQLAEASDCTADEVTRLAGQLHALHQRLGRPATPPP
jgi:DNA-binding MarR family transcriptional regulator